MKLINNISVALIAVFFGLSQQGCKTSFEEIRHSDGNANFDRVAVIGGSHLSGYSDNALYRESQENSVPSILSSRFSFANGGVFRQPLVKEGVGIGIKENSRYILKNMMVSCSVDPILTAKPIAPTGDVTNYNWLGNLFPYNNLAVPNTKIANLSSQSYGNPSQFLGNPLYARFASTPGSSTIIGDALIINPTFLIIWIGIEDIYNYARTGGDQGTDSITNTSAFDFQLNNLMDELTGQAPGGVLLNIPSLTSFPFFTGIAYNDLMLNQQSAAQLNALYASVDTSIKFNAGNNSYVIADPATPSGRRHIKEGEYILLSTPQDSILCEGWGTTVPIPQRYVLDSAEVLKIRNAVIAYNSSITLAAVSKNFAIADINVFLESLKNGLLFNGVNYSSEHLFGGVFSTDGFHFSQRGSAIVANEVIETINNFYAAKLPKADANLLPALIFP